MEKEEAHRYRPVLPLLNLYRSKITFSALSPIEACALVSIHSRRVSFAGRRKGNKISLGSEVYFGGNGSAKLMGFTL